MFELSLLVFSSFRSMELSEDRLAVRKRSNSIIAEVVCSCWKNRQLLTVLCILVEKVTDLINLISRAKELIRSKDSIAGPLYSLISEIFELKGAFKLLRKTLVQLVQVTYGKSINRWGHYDISLMIFFLENNTLSAAQFNPIIFRKPTVIRFEQNKL